MENISPEIQYMRMALSQAECAAEAGEVPCGAILVKDDCIVGKAWNQTEMLNDPTAHAEMLAITQATSALGDWRLNDCVMYVTKEPCPMCAGAIVLARISKVVWGMNDPKRGGAQSRFNILNDDNLNHRVDIQTGVMESECRNIMQAFFQRIR